MQAPRKSDHDRSADRSRPLVRPVPAGATTTSAAHPGPGGPTTPGQALALQRAVGNAATSRMIEQERHSHGAGCGHEPPVQRSAVHDVLDKPGQAFTGPLRTEMEARFGGADFSDVRLHTDTAAQQSAVEIGAQAYTSGKNVVFGPGPIKPKVLAHELRHTQQQEEGEVSGTDHGDGLSMSHQNDDFEKEAEAVSERVMKEPMGESAPAAEQSAERSAGPGPEPAVQRMADDRAVSVTVQRVGGEGSESTPAPEQSGQGKQDKQGKEVIARLSQSIEGHTTLKKMKAKWQAPGTWWPENWMPPGTARLKRTLDRRVMLGEVFHPQDLEDIGTLSKVNPQWLTDVGIGSIAEAEKYTEKGIYKDWMQLPPGKRVLTATLAYNRHLRGDPVPITPDYTLARFFHTRGRTLNDGQKAPLLDERDEQIRQTAVATLHPGGVRPEDRHADADKEKVTKYKKKDDKARDVLSSVLLVLQHGLKIYDKKKDQHIDYRDGDVVRALAHGGRVAIRIPALRGGESPTSLTDFLGVTEEGERAEFVNKRRYATHSTDIGENKDGKRGKFKETGGVLTSVGNRVAEASPVGSGGSQLMGLDISGGGFGSKDWNGDVVLPNGSYGHMLLVFDAPTAKKDGSLLVGIETVAPKAYSPVGYVHDWKSTEATSNPESVMHGHKPDKEGSGKLGQNQRLVDLKEMGDAQGSGDWRAFLNDIKDGWYEELRQTTEGSDERQALYQQLVGRRQNFYGQTAGAGQTG
jgi:hypothetical protein